MLRINRFTLFALLIVFSCASFASGQDENQASRTINPDQLPWAVKLGARAAQVNKVIPVVDRVVLVPDMATYLDEIAKWSLQGHWPVLFEDARYAPMFIRRFQPATVIRREPVDALPEDQSELEKFMESVVTTAWGGDPKTDSLRETFAQHQFTPCGVVFASVDDPAWTAALALAVGHGQPLVWLEGSYGRPNDVLSAQQFGRLRANVDARMREQGYSSGKLGDELDTITLCRSLAAKTSSQSVSQSANPNESGPLAVSDLIGRHAGGERYAFTGWIFGNEIRSAYVAMCSLFLDRKNVELINTYSLDKQPKAAYKMSAALALLNKNGYATNLRNRQRATKQAWLTLLRGGLRTDVLAMNSHGFPTYFGLFDGTRAGAYDVPVLNTPAAIVFIHSLSLKNPTSLETVGGRWLDQGGYAYVGSVDEPYLGGFIPPSTLAKRWVSFVPFLIAARHWHGRAGRPWKIATYGDPLMICPSPEQASRERIDRPAEYGRVLREEVKALMRKSANDEDGSLHVDAIRTLELLGEDAVAVEMWRRAVRAGFGQVASGPALGPLFRQHNSDEFMQAWQQQLQHNGYHQTMLWHLMTPLLSPSMDKQTLLQLQSAVRQPQSEYDAKRLHPHLLSAFGPAHTRAFLEQELNRTNRKTTTKTLEQLLQQTR